MDRASFMAMIVIKTPGACSFRVYLLLMCYACMGLIVYTRLVEFFANYFMVFFLRCQHNILLSPPKEKHSVKYAELLKTENGGEPGGQATGLNVRVDDSHMELIFHASSPNDAKVSTSQIAAV